MARTSASSRASTISSITNCTSASDQPSSSAAFTNSLRAANRPAWVGLAGPTASGKSAIAMALAERVPIEIVSVDSALV